MLTAVWQPTRQREHDWISEVFGPLIKEHVQDGAHRLTMDDCLLIDNFIHRNSDEYYRQFESRKNVYLVHLSDEQYHGGYQYYRYFNAVFRNYWSTIFRRDSVLTFPLGYSNGLGSKQNFGNASQRKFVWSFAGEVGRSSRPDMLRALEAVNPKLVHASDTPNASPLPQQQYGEILCDSAFAPCPMGRLNLECFRLYEALECGAIPIVERRATLDYFTSLLGNHPLLTVSAWSDAPGMMTKLLSDPDRLDDKQAEITSWWREYKANLKDSVQRHISQASRRKSKPAKGVTWQYSMPLWQPIELARHHSLTAMTRRVGVQWKRLVAGQSVIYRPN